jgi:serine/threonine-protein kinase
MSLTPGTRLGPYEVTAPIGAGGMGEVWRARDTKLGRDVALKILPDAFTHDPDRVARFQREAQILATLNHSGIAHIYGLEDANSHTALVMEFVPGATLADRIARGPVALDEALPIARQIAEALEAAHEQGIIHRDLKPANIKVREDGTVKVLDFGLAKALAPDGSIGSAIEISHSPTITSPAMTRQGVILGTAAYMSPEQARGKPVDRRTDIWAFGCVLYEMLTGKRAFDDEDTSLVLSRVLRLEPDFTALPSATPPGVRRLLKWCLQKDPGQRLPHLGLARFEIDDGGGSSERAEVNSGAPRFGVKWFAAAAFVCLMAIAAAIILSVGSTAPPASVGVARFILTLPEDQRFSNLGRQSIALSPDGRQIAYVANSQLYLRSLAETDPHPIPGTHHTPNGVGFPAFSPDGMSLAFWSAPDRTIRRVAVSGGQSVALLQCEQPYGVSWESEGILVALGRDGILRVSPDGGKPVKVVAVGDDELAATPQLLPDGQTVLFTVFDTREGTLNRRGNGSVATQTSAPPGRTTIGIGSFARYVPSGHLVYSEGTTLFAVPFDLRTLQTAGEPVILAQDLRGGLNGSRDAENFTVSMTGALAYIPARGTGSMQDLVRRRIDGTSEQLKLPPARYSHPRISPNGRRLAVQIDVGERASIGVYDLFGGSAIRRLTIGDDSRFPVWSADSELVTFQSSRDGDRGIFWQRADGQAGAERLTKPAEGSTHVPESWSPNGELSLSVVRGARASLSIFRLKDRKLEPFGGVESAVLAGSVFSPNGRWIAYHSGDSNPETAVFVQPFPATGARHEVARGNHPSWSADGTELAYSGGQGAPLFVVEVQTQAGFSVSSPVRSVSRSGLPGLGPQSPRNHDVSPDGRYFVGVAPVEAALEAPNSIQVVLNWHEQLKPRVPAN